MNLLRIQNVKSLILVFFVFACATAQTVSAQSDTSNVAPGVNPKDNITKGEVILTYNGFEGDVDTTTVALKYDIAFNPRIGANIEVPFTRFSAPGLSETGMGDIRVRGRYIHEMGRVSVIGSLELVAPTAQDDLLGEGRWQINPGAAAVYAFDELTFGAVAYKHYISVGGDEDRADIDKSELRTLFARLSMNGSWALADAKYTKSHVGSGTETVDLEFEYGRMLTDSIGISGRIGTSFLDSTRDFGLSINLRKLF